jgi:hypothetical protein
MPLYMGTRNHDDLPFDNAIEHSISAEAAGRRTVEINGA